MKYSNELKVGVSVVLAVVIFVIGVRYFEDIPIFRGAYQLTTAFRDAGGLVSGNAVRINGVTVGSIDEVRLDPVSNRARILFHIDRDIGIPRGSVTSISGLSAMGVVRMDITLGPPDSTLYGDGDYVPSTEGGGLDALLARAPGFAERADSLLITANAALSEAQHLMADDQSDLRQTLVAIQGSARSLDRLLRTEQDRLAGALEGVDTLTATLTAFTAEQGDSVAAAVGNLNRVLHRLDANLASLEATNATLHAVVSKIERGDGTLGLLINDPSLYHQLDSTLSTLNAVLLDFQQNPRRYLKDLRLIDVF